MTDLLVEAQVLDGLRRAFSNITDRMETVRKALSNIDGSALGASNLVGDVHDYADHWGYGISQIGKHTDDTVKLIDNVGKTFGDADTKLSDALSKAKH